MRLHLGALGGSESRLASRADGVISVLPNPLESALEVIEKSISVVNGPIAATVTPGTSPPPNSPNFSVSGGMGGPGGFAGGSSGNGGDVPSNGSAGFGPAGGDHGRDRPRSTVPRH